MQRIMLKSKIHRATLTGAHIEYQGSLSLCPALMKAADLLPGEKVLVSNLNNAERFETYVIRGEPGEVRLNGAAALLGKKGHLVIVMAFGVMSSAEARRCKPRIVHVDAKNRPRKAK